jgi:hypothetical protein
LELAVDYVLEPAPDDRFFEAHAPAARQLRRAFGRWHDSWRDSQFSLAVYAKQPTDRLTRGGVIADVLDARDRARVWCVEFRAYGKALPASGIRTVEQAMAGGAAVWRRLTTQEFVLRGRDGSVHGWWADVQAVFSAPHSLPGPADSPAPPHERPTPG